MGGRKACVVRATAPASVAMGYKRPLAKPAVAEEFVSIRRSETLVQNVRLSSARYRVASRLVVGTPALFHYGDTCNRSMPKAPRL